jgi:hypothetical protein
MSALGVIGCAQFVDVGPGSGNAILAAQTAGVDVSEYFVYYQLPLFVGALEGHGAGGQSREAEQGQQRDNGGSHDGHSFV